MLKIFYQNEKGERSLYAQGIPVASVSPVMERLNRTYDHIRHGVCKFVVEAYSPLPWQGEVRKPLL